ncbi:MAG: hypothetical protein WA197_20665 [Candidatus Acidiferrales bacterium]
MNEHGCEFEAFELDEGRWNAPATKFIETAGGTDWKVIWVCDRHHADLAGDDVKLTEHYCEVDHDLDEACGKPARFKVDETWMCAEHYDELMEGL